MPTEIPVADPHTDVEQQGNLLQEYERKFEQLLEDQKLSKLCCDAGLKIVEKGQFFVTLEEAEGPNEMKNLCRECTLSRCEKASRAGGWVLGNAKIGPVLDVKGLSSSRRHGIEISIESLFQEGTASWVRIVNGIDKYVTETSETIYLENVEHRAKRKPVAKARPRPKLGVTLSPISLPTRDRKWIDINPWRFRQDCFAVSKVMIRLLRHGTSIPREDDGAVRFDDFVEEFNVKFVGTSEWTVDAWTTFLAKGGGQKKRGFNIA